MKITSKTISRVNEKLLVCPPDYVKSSFEKIGEHTETLASHAESNVIEIGVRLETLLDVPFTDPREIASSVVFFNLSESIKEAFLDYGPLVTCTGWSATVSRAKDKLRCNTLFTFNVVRRGYPL